MVTQKQLIKLSRDQMDEDFRQKYPFGRFTLHVRDRTVGAFSRKIVFDAGHDLKWELIHVMRRRTTSGGFGGICICVDHGQIKDVGHQNNSFGYSKHFSDLEKFITFCRKKNCPGVLVELFMEKYFNEFGTKM